MNETREIIETIRNMNFCGLCTTGNCRECIRKKAKEKAIEALERSPQIAEISEGDLVCIKTNLLLHPEVLKKVQANFVKQKESGVIVIDGNFEYKIIKAKKEDEA